MPSELPDREGAVFEGQIGVQFYLYNLFFA